MEARVLMQASRRRFIRGLEVDDATLDGCSRRLGSILHSQFAQYVLNVVLYRVLGNAQREGDLLVRQTADNQRQHLNFAPAQVRTRQLRRQRCRYPRRQVRLSRIHGADRL